jgi:hypothetical protein
MSGTSRLPPPPKKSALIRPLKLEENAVRDEGRRHQAQRVSAKVSFWRPARTHHGARNAPDGVYTPQVKERMTITRLKDERAAIPISRDVERRRKEKREEIERYEHERNKRYKKKLKACLMKKSRRRRG